MATVNLEDIKKSFGKTQVIHGIDVDIKDGEFIVIVGPSGCGKSTLLRMVAGLETVTSGEVQIAGERVNEREPAERDIAMVFQNYALYPHMSVYDNMAYGLKIRKLSKADIRERVDRAAEILELSLLLDRRPRQLSGGQRQRVAMGRAIVREPKVFLFDEPLSNLIAKMRVQMRLEIQKLHRRLGTTRLYVTHDQVEAMTLAHRMIVMNRGIAEQIGTPAEVFEKPASIFVAAFIGSPPMNLIPVRVDSLQRVRDDKGVGLNIPGRLVPAGIADRECYLGMRPEHMRLHAPGIPIEIEMIEILGSEQLVHGRHGDTPVVLRCSVAQTRDNPLQVGETIEVGDDGVHPLHWFDLKTGKRIDD